MLLQVVAGNPVTLSLTIIRDSATLVLSQVGHNILRAPVKEAQVIVGNFVTLGQASVTQASGYFRRVSHAMCRKKCRC